MADLGVMKALRQLLKNNQILMEEGFAEHIHVQAPARPFFPMILLELEEIWTNMFLGDTSAHTKVKIKASVLSHSTNTKDVLRMAGVVRATLDGQKVSIEGGMEAVLRLSSSMIDLPGAKENGAVHQYFEALVRG